MFPLVNRYLRLSRTRARRIAGLAGLVVLSTTGCQPTPPGAAAAPPGCEFKLGATDASVGSTALWLDGSSVGGEASAERDADIDWAINSAIERGDRFMVGTFGGTDAQLSVAPCFSGSPLIPAGNNARVRQQHIPDLVAAVRADIAKLPTGRHSTDVLSALRAGVQFANNPATAAAVAPAGTRRVVVVFNGVQTAGCAALPNPLDPTDPSIVDTLVDRCVERGELPDAAGIEITMLGVGRATTDLDAAAVNLLTNLSQRLCEATGASCSVLATRF